MSSYLLHSNVSGKGRTIVLLHGYLSSSQYFKHLRPRLEKNFRVIALDLLGFGKSPKPRAGYTYDDHLEAIHSTLASLGVTEPFTLLGHSMGALIALRYATVFPDDVVRLLLFNPPLFTDKTQMIETHRATGRRYRVMLFSRGRHIYWRALKLIPRNTTRRRPALNFADIAGVSSFARERSYINIIGEAKVFQDLRQTRMPVLLVNGVGDRYEYIKNLQGRQLPSNLSIFMMDADHHPLVRKVADSEALIRSHLLQ